MAENIQDKLIAGGLKEVEKKAQKGEKIQGMGYDTVYKLLTGKNANKKYTGPLPKSKPKMTPIEKFTGKRSVNKSLSEEEKKYIGDKMAGKVVEKMKKGGAAFPDLTGDGKVTKKDILKGRGVKGFKDGGEVRGMGRAYMGSSRKVKIK